MGFEPAVPVFEATEHLRNRMRKENFKKNAFNKISKCILQNTLKKTLPRVHVKVKEHNFN